MAVARFSAQERLGRLVRPAQLARIQFFSQKSIDNANFTCSPLVHAPKARFCSGFRYRSMGEIFWRGIPMWGGQLHALGGWQLL
jgi:hypothetical protein